MNRKISNILQKQLEIINNDKHVKEIMFNIAERTFVRKIKTCYNGTCHLTSNVDEFIVDYNDFNKIINNIPVIPISMVLYRGMSLCNKKKDFKIGDKFIQPLPFSASWTPDIIKYFNTTPCCFFKIIVPKFTKMITNSYPEYIVSTDKIDIIPSKPHRKMAINQLQREVVLPQSIFTIIDIDTYENKTIITVKMKQTKRVIMPIDGDTNILKYEKFDNEIPLTPAEHHKKCK